MHNPGVCGVILTASSQAGAESAAHTTAAESVNRMIDALNADTEMVLVGATAAESAAVEPVVWSRAAYLIQLDTNLSQTDTLRAMLHEVLGRGRDAALVILLDDQSQLQFPTAETVHGMVAAFSAAGDEVWAVVPEPPQQGRPVLMGRRMIELFLRGQRQATTAEILSANHEHVRIIRADTTLLNTVNAVPGWKAP